MFFCANAATFGPGQEGEPDFTMDGADGTDFFR
jgi:hypothetical protein